MNRMFSIVPLAALCIAGFAHLKIAPEHFSHTPAHGLFFAAVGIAQLLWSITSLWHRNRPHAFLRVSGIFLSGGIVILWALSSYVAMPFASTLHPLDSVGAISKIAELVAFAALFWQQTLDRSVKPHRKALRSHPVLLSMIFGVSIWSMASLAAPFLTGLSENPTHRSVIPSSASINTSAYFSIVNSGREVDTLVSVSGVGIGDVTFHKNVVDARDVVQMQQLDGVPLQPHQRVDFSPAESHVMLKNVPRQLYEGDVVNLIFHFGSGRTIPVEFTVYTLPPEGRASFEVIDDFQITNAWIRATASIDGLVSVSAGAYEWRLPQGFPLPRVPDNNPMTAEKVELGRHLFYDPRLSGNGTISCSSCHLQSMAFSDGRTLPIGATGETHPRNSMSLTNSAYSATLTWANPNLLVLERQIPIPMFGEHPIEMGITGHEDKVLARFQQDTDYRALFAAAYPNEAEPVTINNITLALSSFTRTLISGNSRYDQYVQGETNAMSESAKRGMALFFSEGLECHHCHTGFNFTLSTVTANTTFEEQPFFNTGLYNIGGTGAYPTDNTGIYEITNNPSDMGRFRPPTLRNIALTAPYMHDGSLATLEDVIQFYGDGGRMISDGDYAGDGRANPYKNGLVPGFTLTDQEKTDLVAFLKSLTDESFVTDPRFSDPFVENAAGG